MNMITMDWGSDVPISEYWSCAARHCGGPGASLTAGKLTQQNTRLVPDRNQSNPGPLHNKQNSSQTFYHHPDIIITTSDQYIWSHQCIWQVLLFSYKNLVKVNNEWIY